MSVFALEAVTGPAVSLVRITKDRPTPEQAQARRNALWLHLHDVGSPDPVTGRTMPLTVAQIAALWKISKQAVLNGLAEARRVKGRGD